MTVLELLQTNHQIWNCEGYIGFKLFNASRLGSPCVFDSRNDSFQDFRIQCQKPVIRWYYHGGEKIYYIDIDGGED